jgi:hypothetical protein
MRKFKILTCLAVFMLLIGFKVFCQNKSQKQVIDSIVFANEKRVFIKDSFVGDSLRAIYYIDSNSKSVIKIKVETLDNFRKKWIYWYYLDSNQRLIVVSADRIGGKVFRRSSYYFYNDKLIYKKEVNTKINNPEKQFESVIFLLERMGKIIV